MTAPPDPQSRLSLLRDGDDEDVAWQWFCGRCAARPGIDGDLPVVHRVCTGCGFGLLVRARADELPTAGAPFLLVDASLAVQAMSEAAEAYLNVSELAAVNHQLSVFLVSADRTGAGSGVLAAALRAAACGDSRVSEGVVSRSSTFGDRIAVRISACGPPPAALVVLDSASLDLAKPLSATPRRAPRAPRRRAGASAPSPPGEGSGQVSP